LAEWDGDGLTVWGTTKIPYFNRRTLAPMLGVDEAQIHFVETTPAAASARAASSTPRTS